MKQILFFTLTLFVCSLSAQEVISETQQYIPYQDSLFVLKTTKVISTGYENLNDTLVSYAAPTDTSGLADQLHIAYLNESNTATVKMRNAAPFRFVLANYLASKNILALLGRNLDSINVARFGNALSGMWRVFREDGTNFFVDIAPHPTNPTFLRATGTNGEGNFNILVYNRWFFRFALGAGDVKFLTWDGNSSTLPVYRNPVSMTTPTAVQVSSNFRMVKLN